MAYLAGLKISFEMSGLFKLSKPRLLNQVIKKVCPNVLVKIFD